MILPVSLSLLGLRFAILRGRAMYLLLSLNCRRYVSVICVMILKDLRMIILSRKRWPTGVAFGLLYGDFFIIYGVQNQTQAR